MKRGPYTPSGPREPTKPVYVSRTITVRDDQDDAIQAIVHAHPGRTYSGVLRHLITIALAAGGAA